MDYNEIIKEYDLNGGVIGKIKKPTQVGLNSFLDNIVNYPKYGDNILIKGPCRIVFKGEEGNINYDNLDKIIISSGENKIIVKLVDYDFEFKYKFMLKSNNYEFKSEVIDDEGVSRALHLYKEKGHNKLSELFIYGLRENFYITINEELSKQDNIFWGDEIPIES